MNLDAVLPMLLKDADPKMAGLLSALSGGGDKIGLMEGLLGKDEKTKELLKMMSLMQSSGGTNKPPKAQGLKAIYSFAPKDILGIMIKYYSK